jgi:hypothetical protein
MFFGEKFRFSIYFSARNNVPAFILKSQAAASFS